jgi:AbrB family looped-hinge helix DNA binding protein
VNLAVTSLSSRGQIVIPKPLRDQFQWLENTVFTVQAQGSGIMLTPVQSTVKTKSLREAVGSKAKSSKHKLSLAELTAPVDNY